MEVFPTTYLKDCITLENHKGDKIIFEMLGEGSVNIKVKKENDYCFDGVMQFPEKESDKLKAFYSLQKAKE
jgi:hypothetical protein